MIGDQRQRSVAQQFHFRRGAGHGQRTRSGAVALEENRSQNGNQKKKFENVWQLKKLAEDFSDVWQTQELAEIWAYSDRIEVSGWVRQRSYELNSYCILADKLL
jgi:hypothetical protein